MSTLADRVKDLTISTGTGAITLADSSPTGFRTFATAFGAGSTVVNYCIDDMAGRWEVGSGTFNGTTGLTRTTVLSSSNGNALVTFVAGSKTVFCTAPATLLDTAADYRAANFVAGLDYLTPTGSVAGLSGLPTTLPASDVFTWAKETTKPSYTKSEVGLENVPNLSFSGTNTGDQTNVSGTASGLSANLPVSKLNSGTSASATTFWRGDAKWVSPTVAVAGVTGLGTGVATALAVAIGGAGAPAIVGGALGIPSSGELTNCTGLPVAGIAGLGTNVHWLLETPVGTSNAILYDSGPLGMPSRGYLNFCEGLPLGGTGVTGTLPIAHGGTGNTSGTSTGLTGTPAITVGALTATTGTFSGAITATGNITAYYSDDRLKTNLGCIKNALDKVKKLSGFYFEANATAQSLGYEVKREVGVSAQQVQSVMPEVISPAPIDAQYMTVHYDKLIPLLIEAVKELSDKVDAL